MLKISVIIPVYNTEKYLSECLDSILNQTIQDIEVICVNDGSTDNSLRILEEYAQKDNRIRVISQKNEGPGVARNKGLYVAKGEFISFIDSDDYLGSDGFYEILYNAAAEAHADAAKGVYVDSETKISYNTYNLNDKIKEDKNCFIAEYLSAIFKRSTLEENNIRFPILSDMEDPVFTFLFSQKAKKVVISEDARMMKRRRIGAITDGIPNFMQIREKMKGFHIIFNYRKNLSGSKSFAYTMAFWFSLIWNDISKNKNILTYCYSLMQMGFIYNVMKKSLMFVEYLKQMNMDTYFLFRNTVPYEMFKIFIRNIFSVINNHDKNHKIITILGIKISFKIKRK